MPPLRAVSIFWCWAWAALLLPGCDGKGILEDLFGSHKTSLQTDDRASGARRAFDSDAADVAEPKGSSRNHQSGEKGVLSGMKAALMNNVWVKAFSATFSAHREKATQVRLSWSEVGVRLGTLSWRLPASRREGTSNPPREEKKGSDFTRNQRRTSGVKVPECPPHPMESLPEQTRRDTPLKSWIAAGIEVKAQPSSSSPPTARVCGGKQTTAVLRLSRARRVASERRRVCGVCGLVGAGELTGGTRVGLSV